LIDHPLIVISSRRRRATVVRLRIRLLERSLLDTIVAFWGWLDWASVLVGSGRAGTTRVGYWGVWPIVGSDVVNWGRVRRVRAAGRKIFVWVRHEERLVAGFEKTAETEVG